MARERFWSCSYSLPIYLLAYGLFLASFALANWVEFDGGNGERYAFGLWWNCTTFNVCPAEDAICSVRQLCEIYDIDSLTDSWIASQSFYIIAMVLGFVAGTIYAKLPLNGTFQVISGASILISVIVFAISVDLEEGESYDYAFYLGPVAGVLMLCNGLALLYFARQQQWSFDDMPLKKPLTAV